MDLSESYYTNGTPQMELHKLFSEIEDKKKAVYNELFEQQNSDLEWKQ